MAELSLFIRTRNHRAFPRQSSPFNSNLFVWHQQLLDVGFNSTVAYNLSMNDIVVRRATESDLPALGELGALLMQTHYGFDKQRFMAPGPNPAEGYGWFLGSQLTEEDVIVLVAERQELWSGMYTPGWSHDHGRNSVNPRASFTT